MSTLLTTKDFAPAAREYLNAFYTGHKVKLSDVKGKIAAIREHIIKEPMLVASSDGILDDESELQALELYVLDSVGL